MSTRAGVTRQRGFALLIVLWTLGLLALLVAGLAASGRSATELAGNLRASATAEAAADGGVQQAVFQLQRGAWQPDGALHRSAIGQAAVVIAIEDQDTRINPNFSSPAMLAALLGAVGADPAQARDLSSAMVDWRTATTVSLAGGLKLDRYRLANLPYGPPSRPFSSVDEIGQVAGMSADLLARLRPYISVYQTGDAQTGGAQTGDAQTGDAQTGGAQTGSAQTGSASETATSSFNQDVLRDAAMIGHTSALIGFTSPDEVVLIRATAVLADGTRFVRRAVVRLAAQARPGERAWQILSWN